VTLMVSNGVPASTIASVERTSYTIVGGNLVEQSDCTYVPGPQQDFAVPQGTCAPVDGSPSALTPSPTAASATLPQSAQGGSGPAATTPAPSAPNLSALKGFPGKVLVLPLDQPPYADWSFHGAQLCPKQPCDAETVGGPERGVASDGMSIAGAVGVLDPGADPHAYFKPTCQSATPYCYYPSF
jgi:hypothetical protein